MGNQLDKFMHWLHSLASPVGYFGSPNLHSRAKEVMASGVHRGEIPHFLTEDCLTNALPWLSGILAVQIYTAKQKSYDGVWHALWQNSWQKTASQKPCLDCKLLWQWKFTQPSKRVMMESGMHKGEIQERRLPIKRLPFFKTMSDQLPLAASVFTWDHSSFKTTPNRCVVWLFIED